MSRSRKSVSIPTYKSKSMRLWRRSVNKIVRARAKQLLRTTVDFDNLIMPVQNDGGDYYNSPRDGGGAWFWKVYSWWDDAQRERRWQDYVKGFRK